MSDIATNPNQLLFTDEFEGRVRRTPSGRYSLSNLTMADIRKIESAFSMELTTNNCAAHSPQPFWWNETTDGGDHRIWFESCARYYRDACAVLKDAIDR